MAEREPLTGAPRRSQPNLGQICSGIVCFLVTAVAVTALVIAILAFNHTKKDSRVEQFRHVFCIDAYDRLNVDVYTQLHAKLVINTHNNSACLYGLWTRDTANCTSLDSIDIRGPVNEDELLDASYVIGSFDDVASTNETGTLDVCFHLTPSNARRLLKNPSLVYIEMALTGSQCSDGVYRDYVTSLCSDASFKYGQVDDDDTDVDSTNYDAEYESDTSASDESTEARRVKIGTAHRAVATKVAAAKAAGHHGGQKVGAVAAANARHHH